MVSGLCLYTKGRNSVLLVVRFVAGPLVEWCAGANQPLELLVAFRLFFHVHVATSVHLLLKPRRIPPQSLYSLPHILGENKQRERAQGRARYRSGMCVCVCVCVCVVLRFCQSTLFLQGTFVCVCRCVPGVRVGCVV
jgi:hypothetical protein